MSEEVWRVFPLDPRFQISSEGQVQGLRCVLKLQRDKDGYPIFIAWKSRKGKLHKVHRAVVQTFLGDIPEGMQVNHINGIRHDNRVENLEVVTPGANILHGFRVLGRKMTDHPRPAGERHHNSKLTTDMVLEIRRLHAQGRQQNHIAAMFDTSSANIFSIVHRKAWRHV